MEKAILNGKEVEISDEWEQKTDEFGASYNVFKGQEVTTVKTPPKKKEYRVEAIENCYHCNKPVTTFKLFSLIENSWIFEEYGSINGTVKREKTILRKLGLL